MSVLVFIVLFACLTYGVPDYLYSVAAQLVEAMMAPRSCRRIR